MAVAARLYCGDWIGDCPRPGCCNAEQLFGLRNPRRPIGPTNPRTEKMSMFRCSNCLMLDEVQWPAEDFMVGVWVIVSQRPVPQTRNWFPAEHPMALAGHLEHGQTLSDLLAENEAHGVTTQTVHS